VVLLTDGRVGVQMGDREILTWLRHNHPGKPLLLAVNKCDNSGTADLMASEFWELGLEPYPLSAINGSGTGDMLDALVKVGVVAFQGGQQQRQGSCVDSWCGSRNVSEEHQRTWVPLICVLRIQALPPPKDMDTEVLQEPLAIAIVGRPNVGEWMRVLLVPAARCTRLPSPYFI
jgi:predicted GTPase